MMALNRSLIEVLRHPGKVLALSVGIAGLVLGASGVFASLVAQATADQTASTGALKVSLAAGTGSAGFSTNIGAMRPGSTVRRLVTLNNPGGLTGSNLVMRITADNNAFTQALTVAVVKCTATGYACTSAGTVLGTTTVNTLTGASTQSVDTSFTAGENVFLQFTFALPTLGSPVTTANGALTGYQGVSGNINVQFETTQEAASTTNS